MRPGGPLPLVQTEIHAAHDRWIGSEVLLHRTSPTVLDRGAALDDAGDRGGPTLGRLPKGVSHERARCLRGHSAVRDIPDSWSLPGQPPKPSHSEGWMTASRLREAGRGFP